MLIIVNKQSGRKKYYRKIDDLMYFDQDNFLLRKVIKDTLKNFEEI